MLKNIKIEAKIWKNGLCNIWNKTIKTKDAKT